MDSIQKTENGVCWEKPPANLELPEGECHIWRAFLDGPAAQAPQLTELLASDELQRAVRFRFDVDRLRFIVRRGLLRIILARYLNVRPGQLQFNYSPDGKPSLAQTVDGAATAVAGAATAAARGRPAGSPVGCTIDFSLSHSHGLAVYAFTRGTRVGVDLEQARPIAQADQIVEHFFSEEERRTYRALPLSQRQEAFFNCWTRKEAYLKASEGNLEQVLSQVQVSLAPGEPAELRSTGKAGEEISRWSLQVFSPAPGYIAALVAAGRNWQMKYWQATLENEFYIDPSTG